MERIIINKIFSSSIFLIGIVLLFYLLFFTTFNQKSSAEQVDRVHKDDRIGVTLKFERADDYLPEWKLTDGRYLPPKAGHDYVAVTFTVDIIKNCHIVGFGGRDEECSVLYNTKGKKYKLASLVLKKWKFFNLSHLTGGGEMVQGGIGIMIFEFPKTEQPAELSFVYYFKISLEDKHKQTGKIKIMISPGLY